jgi:hypothetical protein
MQIIIGCCCAGVFIVVLLIGLNMLWFQSGTARRLPPNESEMQESRLIADQINMVIQDFGVPSDTKDLSNFLFGNNPLHKIYLNQDAFKVDQFGQICDEGGKPYLILIKNGKITVTSQTYSQSTNETYIK